MRVPPTAYASLDKARRSSTSDSGGGKERKAEEGVNPTIMARRVRPQANATQHGPSMTVQILPLDIENPSSSPSKPLDSPLGGGRAGSVQPEAYAYAALFGVAMLWGSYAPAIRYIFLSDE